MKNRKKGSVISTIILVIAIGIFCYSGFQLYKIYSSYREGDNEYNQIQKLAVTKSEEKDEKLKIDFNKLKEINQDVVGWIKFDEPSIINYPVVHSHNNREYLKKLFGEGKNTYGTLFVDMYNRGDFIDRNTVIYGHRMKSGSMFGQLEKYADEEFYKQNPYFYIYTPDGKESIYQIFSAGVVKYTSDNYKKVFNSDEEFLSFIETIKASSNYQTDAQINADSKVITLSTCTIDSNEDRFVVHGVKVGER